MSSSHLAMRRVFTMMLGKGAPIIRLAAVAEDLGSSLQQASGS
jgi:hypothetical protein